MRNVLIGLTVLGVLALQAPTVCAETPPGPVLYWGTLGSGPNDLDHPFGIASDATGKLYVADQHNNRISIFGPTGDLLGQFGYVGFSDPTGIDVAPDGSIWVTSHHNHRVYKFTNAGTHLLTLGGLPGGGGAPGNFEYPVGVVTDNVGNVYITQLYTPRVQKFAPDGTLLGQFGSGGAGALWYPYGIDLVGNTVFVADQGDNRVKMYATDGTYLGQWGAGMFGGIEGIAHDASGNLFVCDTGNNRVLKTTQSGSVLSIFGGYGTALGQMYTNSDIAIDPNGEIFVCEWNNSRIQRFSYTFPTATQSASWGSVKKAYR